MTDFYISPSDGNSCDAEGLQHFLFTNTVTKVEDINTGLEGFKSVYTTLVPVQFQMYFSITNHFKLSILQKNCYNFIFDIFIGQPVQQVTDNPPSISGFQSSLHSN